MLVRCGGAGSLHEESGNKVRRVCPSSQRAHVVCFGRIITSQLSAGCKGQKRTCGFALLLSLTFALHPFCCCGYYQRNKEIIGIKLTWLLLGCCMLHRGVEVMTFQGAGTSPFTIHGARVLLIHRVEERLHISIAVCLKLTQVMWTENLRELGLPLVLGASRTPDTVN